LIDRPRDGEFGIVPENGTLARRVVAASGLVEDFGGLGENEKAMCKAFGYPEELEFAVLIAGLEIEGGPAAEVGRVATKIYGNVPDVAGEDPDEFTLWMTELVVETAKNTARGKRLVVLGKGRWKAKRSEGLCVKDFSEPSTCVAVAFGLQDFYIAQGGVT
jgi:hypothetical protein